MQSIVVLFILIVMIVILDFLFFIFVFWSALRLIVITSRDGYPTKPISHIISRKSFIISCKFYECDY